MDLQQLSNQVSSLVKSTGTYILAEREKFSLEHVEVKSLNQLVSYVDKEAERQLAEGLSQLIPQAGFIAEEGSGSNHRNEWTWVIDPLDGTTNFIHGLPVYSISVGLLHHGKEKVGVVYHVPMNEMFVAWENGGAWLNGKKINVSPVRDLSKSLMATGFPYYDFKGMEPYLNVLKNCMKQTHGLRRMGSAAIDLAYVACGRFEGFFEYGLSPWDVAGGSILIKEAGGVVSDFDGGNNYIMGKTIIAANAGVYEQFFQMIKTEFNRGAE